MPTNALQSLGIPVRLLIVSSVLLSAFATTQTALCQTQPAPTTPATPAKPAKPARPATPAKSARDLKADADWYKWLSNDPHADSITRSEMWKKYVDTTCQYQWVLQRPILESGGVAMSTYLSDCHTDMTSGENQTRGEEPAPQAKSTPPPVPAPSPQAASRASHCTLESADPASKNDTETLFVYSIHCDQDVSPNELAILTTPGKSYVSTQAGIAGSLGIQLQDYDPENFIVTFRFPQSPSSQVLVVSAPTASIDVAIATYLLAFGPQRDVSACAQASGQTPVGCYSAHIKFPVMKATPATPTNAAANPSAKQATTCAVKGLDSTLPVPAIDSITVATTTASGKLPKTTNGKTANDEYQVQLCSSGKIVGGPEAVHADGTFNVGISKMQEGQTVIAQLIKPAAKGSPQSFSEVDEKGVKVTQASCKKAEGPGTAPTFGLHTNAGVTSATVFGNLTNSTYNKVRICVGDIPVDEPKPMDVNPDGSFSSGSIAVPVKKGDKITVQSVSAETPPKYGQVSAEQSPDGTQVAAKPAPTLIMIGGVEQAGYSSVGQSTNPFVQMYYEGIPTGNFTGWGRVRLLSTPVPTTQGIAGSFTNTAGQLTTKTFANVGQGVDYVAGVAYKLGPRDARWSLIAGFGATTPLTSQSVTESFVVPPQGTAECTTLLTRFSLTPAATGSGSCIAGGIKDLAFSNQDRSNFLLKYGAGFRTYWRFPCKGGTPAKPCSDGIASLDITFGQDEAVSGGRLHGGVFKLDGVLPIPTGNSSWLYLFSSAYIRTQGNVNLSPLILQIPTSPITTPSPSVLVLPLRQPNRDYFRLGIGVNLSQVFCEFGAAGCANKNTGSDSTATDTSAGAASAKAKN
jgi:hypothetical protein